MTTKNVKPLPRASVQAAEELIDSQPQKVETMQVSVGGVAGATASGASVEADASVSAAVANAIAAERQRIAEIAKAADAGQEKLAMELMASGKSKLEALEAFNADLKQRKAETPADTKPEVKAEDVAAAVLKELRAGTPDMPSTSEGSEPNVYDKYKAISDPNERRAFYEANKAEIDRISKSPKNKKEG